MSLNRTQKKKLINGASSLLKSLVKGASKSQQRTTKSNNSPVAPPAKAPCGACGGSK